MPRVIPAVEATSRFLEDEKLSEAIAACRLVVTGLAEIKAWLDRGPASGQDRDPNSASAAHLSAFWCRELMPAGWECRQEDVRVGPSG